MEQEIKVNEIILDTPMLRLYIDGFEADNVELLFNANAYIEILCYKDKLAIKNLKEIKESRQEDLKRNINSQLTITTPIFNKIIERVSRERDKYSSLSITEANPLYLILKYENEETSYSYTFNIENKKISVQTSGIKLLQKFEIENLMNCSNHPEESITYVLDILNNNTPLVIFLSQMNLATDEMSDYLCDELGRNFFFAVPLSIEKYDITCEIKVPDELMDYGKTNMRRQHHHFGLKILTEKNKFYFYDQAHSTPKFEIFINLLEAKKCPLHKHFSFDENLIVEYDNLKNLKELMILFLSYMASYNNLRTTMIYMGNKSSKDTHKEQAAVYKTKYETIKNEDDKRVNCKVFNNYFTMEIGININNWYFVPTITYYQESIIEEYRLLIDYFKGYDRRFYKHFSFFHVLFFEYEEFPQYQVLVKSIIKHLVQTYKKTEEDKNPLTAPKCYIKIDWIRLCLILNKESNQSKSNNIYIADTKFIISAEIIELLGEEKKFILSFMDNNSIHFATLEELLTKVLSQKSDENYKMARIRNSKH